MELLETIRASETVYRLGWTLLHTLWLGAGVGVIFAAALWVLRRRSAAARYLAGCAAMAAMVLLPAAVFWSVPPPPAPTAVKAAPMPPPILPPLQAVDMPPSAPLELEAPASGGVASPPAAVKLPDEPSPLRRAPLLTRAPEALAPALPWIVLAWAAGVLGLSLWRLGGWIGVHRIKRLGTRPAGADLVQTVAHLARALRVGRAVRVVESILVRVPTVVGWLRPVILLPVGLATGLTPEQLRAVLVHELAHVRRYDYLVNLLQTLVEIVLFHHPAVWFISRRIRLERENCCDDLALAAGADSLEYAAALATLGELSLSAPHPALAATGGKLLPRIRRIVGLPAYDAPGPRWLAGALIATTLLAAGLIIYGCAAREQDERATTRPAPPRASTQPAGAPYRRAFLGDQQKGLKQLLDLKTGEILKDLPDGGTAAYYTRLGKGDLAFDSDFDDETDLALFVLRGGRASRRDGRGQGPLKPLTGSDEHVSAYPIKAVPMDLRVRTGDGAAYDVRVLGASDDGLQIEYRRAGEHATTSPARADTSSKGADRQPAKRLVFGPVMHRVVNHMGENCLIDLDSGRLITPPREVFAEGAGRALRWMEEHGVDVGGGAQETVQGLIGFDIIAFPQKNEAWDKWSARTLAANADNAFQVSKPGSPVFLTAKGGVPATYIFRTREGGVGILQILEVKESRDTRIRYKTLQDAGGGESTVQPAARRPKQSAFLLPGSRVSLAEALDGKGRLIALCRAGGDPSGFLSGPPAVYFQEFRVVQVLSGASAAKDVAIRYTPFEHPGRERMIKEGREVIWIAHPTDEPDMWRGVKALLDTHANRKALGLAPATQPVGMSDRARKLYEAVLADAGQVDVSLIWVKRRERAPDRLNLILHTTQRKVPPEGYVQAKLTAEQARRMVEALARVDYFERATDYTGKLLEPMPDKPPGYLFHLRVGSVFTAKLRTFEDVGGDKRTRRVLEALRDALADEAREAVVRVLAQLPPTVTAPTTRPAGGPAPATQRAGELLWGQAVDGVQVRLRADRKRWRINEVPTFKADIRSTPKWRVPLDPKHCVLEIDGRVHNPVGNPGKSGKWRQGRSGEPFLDIPVRAGPQWWPDVKKLLSEPGKHIVRLGVRPSPVPKGLALKAVRRWSNPVEIEVLAASTTRAASTRPGSR